MKLKIFSRSSLFPSRSGEGLSARLYLVQKELLAKILLSFRHANVTEGFSLLVGKRD
jgi:hypothetical protein